MHWKDTLLLELSFLLHTPLRLLVYYLVIISCKIIVVKKAKDRRKAAGDSNLHSNLKVKKVTKSYY
jgi:hypothetical protein